MEIIQPLISEGIASVSGRLTNGRYHHGSFTKLEKLPLEFQQGYQKALMDFHNYLNDFVVQKNKLLKIKVEEKTDKEAPLYNPFMEELSEN